MTMIYDIMTVRHGLDRNGMPIAKTAGKGAQTSPPVLHTRLLRHRSSLQIFLKGYHETLVRDFGNWHHGYLSKCNTRRVTAEQITL